MAGAGRVRNLKDVFDYPGKPTWKPTGHSGDHVGDGKYKRMGAEPPKPKGPPPPKSLSDLP